MVQRTILRLAFPGGKPRPKPGPYRGTEAEAYNRNGGSTNGSSNGARSNGKSKLEQEAGPRNDGGSGPEQDDSGVKVELPDD